MHIPGEVWVCQWAEPQRLPVLGACLDRPAVR